MNRIIIAALAVAAMVGCQKEGGVEETPNQGDAKVVSFSSQIATRASGTDWESGDVVGIMVTRDNAIMEDYKYNAMHNVDVSNGTTLCSFNPESLEHTLYYPIDSTETIDFYGYYPYLATLSIDDQTYPIDVVDQSEPTTLDFMEASTILTKPEGYSSSSEEAVTLSFTRRMSKLTFVITAGDGLELEDITAITLKGFYTTADYDFPTNEFTNIATEVDITPYQNSDDTYSAIVIPTKDSDQEVYTPTSHTIVFTTTSGDVEWDITDVDLNAGAHRIYNVTVASTPLVSGGNEISEWDEEDGGSLEVE